MGSRQDRCRERYAGGNLRESGWQPRLKKANFQRMNKVKISVILLLLAALASLPLQGCSILPKEPEPKTYFVLEAPAETAPIFQSVISKALLLGASGGGIFVASPRIVFSDSPGTRSYYQFSFWTEPPTLQFNRALIAKFDRSKAFSTVSRSSVAAIGDLQLNTEIQEFYQDRSVEPATAKVVVTADLIAVTDRKILASRSFTESAPIGEDNAAGAVAALSKATDKLQNNLINWVVESAPKGD